MSWVWVWDRVGGTCWCWRRWREEREERSCRARVLRAGSGYLRRRERIYWVRVWWRTDVVMALGSTSIEPAFL